MTAKERKLGEALTRSHRKDELIAVTNQIDETSSSMLDLGSGIGALIPLLYEKAPSATIIAFDISEYMLGELEKKNLDIHTVLGESPHLPFKSESFDVVVALRILHEIIRHKGKLTLLHTLKSVFYTLTLNGRVIIFDHHSTEQEITEIVQQSGFRISSVEHMKNRRFFILSAEKS